MIYLQNFIFPSEYSEENYLDEYYSVHVGNTYHTNMYPFKVLSGIGMFRLDFEPITILYGGNGSGKSTALNVISQKLHIERQSVYNSGELMDAYVDLCSFETDMRWTGEEFSMTGRRSGRYDIGDISCMITSDDIFKALLQDRVSREQTLMKSRMLTDKAGASKDAGQILNSPDIWILRQEKMYNSTKKQLKSGRRAFSNTLKANWAKRSQACLMVRTA